MNTVTAYDIKAATAILTGVAEDLAQQPWFGQQNWMYSVHPYPAPPALPQSVTLHVYKGGWFNEDHQGIHFETFLSPKEWRSGQVPVMMHILHTSHIPATKLKRIKLSQPFIDKCYSLISGWPGYVFRAGKYGTHPFTRQVRLDHNKSDLFTTEISNQFALLCQALGPVMDKTIAEVIKD